MAKQEQSSSQALHQTDDGSETSSPKSDKYSKPAVRLTDRKMREMIRLYKAKAGTAREIAEMYGVHVTTIYKGMKRFNVRVNNGNLSAATSAAMLRLHAAKRETKAALNNTPAAPMPETKPISFEQIPWEPPIFFDGDWGQLARDIEESNPRAVLVQNFMYQSSLLSHEGNHFTVSVPVRSLTDGVAVAKTKKTLSAHFGTKVEMTVRFIPPKKEEPLAPAVETAVPKQSIFGRIARFFNG